MSNSLYTALQFILKGISIKDNQESKTVGYGTEYGLKNFIGSLELHTVSGKRIISITPNISGLWIGSEKEIITIMAFKVVPEDINDAQHWRGQDDILWIEFINTDMITSIKLKPRANMEPQVFIKKSYLEYGEL